MRFIKHVLLVCILFALQTLCGCGSSSPAASVSVSVSGSQTVTLGATAQFEATVAGSTNTAVTWSVNGTSGGSATAGTISSAGVYTAPTTMPSSSTITITATSAADSTKSGSIQVTLKAAPVSVSVSGSQTVTLGATAQFEATVAGSTNTAVTWSVNGTSGGSATVGTISSAGVYTAPTTMPSSSTITITATSVADSTALGNITVTLQAPDGISGLQSVTLGVYAQYTAVVNGSSNSLTWSVNGVSGGSADVGTITSTGLYLAPLTMPSSSAITIAASDPNDTSKSQSMQVTLQSTAPTTVSMPTVVSAKAMGIVKQNTHVIGRDGNWSALINGKSYWSFNDTSMNAANAEGLNFISNTRAWTSSLDASNGIDLSNDYLDADSMPTEFIPFTADETAFNKAHGSQSGCSTTTDSLCGEAYAIWPGAVLPVPNSTTGEAYHIYVLILRGGSISNWDVVGIGIAHEQSGVITRPDTLSPGTAHPTLMWQGNTSMPYSYSGGGMVQGDMVYMTGCAQSNMFGYPMCTIARVPIENILTLSDWTYYNGTSGKWVTDPTQATMIFYGGAAGNTIFFNPALNQYMTIFSVNYSNNLVYQVAPTPWGPWSDGQNANNQGTGATIITGVTPIDSSATSTVYDYAGQPHPEFQEQNGLVQYATYVQDDSDLGFCGQNIQLVRIVFAPAEQ